MSVYRVLLRPCLLAVLCTCSAVVARAQDDPDLATYQFWNQMPYPVDIYLLDENEDPPEELYQATVPNVRYKDAGGGMKHIVGEFKPTLLEFYPGTRFRLKMHKKRNDAWERSGTKLPDQPSPDTFTLYDLPTVPGEPYAHSLSNYFSSRVTPGTEVVLFGKKGVLLADDNIYDNTPKSRTGTFLRAEDSSLFDPESEKHYYRWLVRRGLNKRPGTISLQLIKTDDDQNRSAVPVYLQADPQSPCGLAVANVADNYPFKDLVSFKLELWLTKENGPCLTLEPTAPDSPARGNGSHQYKIVPWGAAAAPAELLKLLEMPVSTGEDWRKADSPGIAPVSLAKKTTAAPFSGRDQVDSATSYCRAGYHQLLMNPFDLQDNGLDGGHGNPIFATPLDRAKSDEFLYYVSGNSRVPFDFYLQRQIKQEMSGRERSFTGEQELSEIVASSLGFDLSTQVTVGWNSPIGPTANATTNISYGMDNATSQEVANTFGSSSTTLVKTKWGSQFYLILNRDYAVLADGFKADALALTANSTAEAFDEFFLKYGTHYPIATLMGGRVTAYSSSEDSSSSQFLKDDGQFNWSGGVALIMKGSNGQTNSSKNSQSNRNLEWNSAMAGGSGGDFESWTASQTTDLIPIKVYLRPIWQLIDFDLLFGKEGTEADALLVQELRTALFRNWLRHLAPPESAAAEGSIPEDTFGISLDQFRITCDKGQENNLPDTYTFSLEPRFYHLNSLEGVTIPRNPAAEDSSAVRTLVKDSHLPEAQEFTFNLRNWANKDLNRWPRSFSHTFKTPAGPQAESMRHWNESFAFGLRCRLYEGNSRTRQEARFENGVTYFIDTFGKGLLHQSAVLGRDPRAFWQKFIPLYREDEFQLAFISSPVRVLKRAWNARPYWPGMDEVEMRCVLEVTSSVTKAKIPVTMTYRVRAGLLQKMLSDKTPLDEGMPVVAAFEPSSRKLSGKLTLETLPGRYRTPSGQMVVVKKPETAMNYGVWEDPKSSLAQFVVAQRQDLGEITFYAPAEGTEYIGDVDYVTNATGQALNRITGFHARGTYYERVGD